MNPQKSSKSFDSVSQPPYKVNLRAFYNCNNEALIRIEVSDDATTKHVPSSVFLVIDVSGSMAAAASTYYDSDGKSGLSQLDMVKHASRTIIESLGEQDKLAVIAFASYANTVYRLAPMTSGNRAEAWKAVEALLPTSSTNLYGGLMKALKLVKKQNTMPSNPNIMLLTDGMPNFSPPRGELESLRNFLDANPRLSQVRISTFGFGYNVNSQLLADIARVGRSIYAFIPDASFVGTVFVNAVSNILATATTSQLTLKLEATKDVKLTGISSGQDSHKTEWGLQVELPSLLYGQTLEILVQTSGDPSKEPFQAFLDSDRSSEPLEASPVHVNPVDVEHSFFAQVKVRSEILNCIRNAGRCNSEKELNQAQTFVAIARQRVAVIAENNYTLDICKMKQDLDGQVKEAYSRLDWHKRWGIHYILSLASAHSLQQCTNFKDMGLETYITKKFFLIRSSCERKFVDLPPPKPSRQVRKSIKSMSAFYSSSAPCFASGQVRMSDGSQTSITDIKAGDCLDRKSVV